MNGNLSLAFWRDSFGLLTLQIAGLVALAALAHRQFRSAPWRRATWQITLAAAGLLTVAEWSGAARSTLDWSRVQLAALSTPAPIPTPAFVPVAPARPVIAPESSALALDLSQISLIQSIPDEIPSMVMVPAPTNDVPSEGSSSVWWPAWLWMAGFVVILLRRILLSAAFAALRGVRCIPVESSLTVRVQALAPRLGLRGRVQVVALPGLTGPVAFGVWRPTIGVPPGYADEFTAAEQDAMLAHELAHVAAHDPAWSWLADAVSAALWWHPLVWFARRQLRAASETAADEASALLHDGPETLAECLVNLGTKLASGPAYGGLGVAEPGFRSALGQRVDRLLKLRSGSWRPPRRWATVATKSFALIALLIVALVCGAWMSPRPARGDTVLDAVWRSLDVSALSGLFAKQVDLAPQLARKPAKKPELEKPMTPVQVRLVVRFAEITVTNNTSPGGKWPEMDWLPDAQSLVYRTNNPADRAGDMTGTVTAVLTDHQFNQAMQALESRGGADILTLPPEIRWSGSPAEFFPPDSRYGIITNRTQNGTVAVAERPASRMGPFVEVTPQVGADGKSIRMNVTSTLIDFDGYDDPGTFVVKTTVASGNTIGVPVEARLPVPRYRNRQVTVSPTISVGQSVLLGRLTYISFRVPKVKDSTGPIGDVPWAGRFFRTGVEKSLLIFVTPTIIQGSESEPSSESVRTVNAVGYVVTQTNINGEIVTVTNAVSPVAANGESSRDRLRRIFLNDSPKDLDLILPAPRPNRPLRQALDAASPIPSRRSFRVDTLDLLAALKASNLTRPGGDFREAIQQYFKMAGVDLPAGAYRLMERVGELLVESPSLEQSAIIERTLASIQPVPAAPGVESRHRQAIRARLRNIVLPMVGFDQTPLAEVLPILRKAAVAADPDGFGVTFSLLVSDSPTVTVTVIPGLKNITLGDALDAVIKGASRPIKYDFHGIAVLLTDRKPDQLRLTGTHKIDLVGLADKLRTPGPLPFEPLTEQSLHDWLTQAGVDLSFPKAVSVDYYNGTLTVRGSPADLEVAERAIEKLDLPQRKAVTNEARGDRISVNTMIQDAKLLLEQDKFAEAEAKLNAAARMDPTNPAVTYYLKLVLEAKNRALLAAVDRQEAQFRSNSRDPLPMPDPIGGTNSSTSGKRQQIKRKIERIILGEVHFDGLPLSEVVKILRAEARRLDPEKVGIDISISTRAADPAVDPTNPGSEAPPINLATVKVTIQPALSNLRLAHALDLIVKTADQPIKYTIDEWGVIFSARTPETQTLYTRFFKVDPKMITQGLQNAGVLDPGVLPESDAFRRFFAKAGVELSPPKTVFFSNRNGAFMVRATLTDLETIGQAVELLNTEPAKPSVGRTTVAQNSPTATTAAPAVVAPTNLFTRTYKIDVRVLTNSLNRLVTDPPLGAETNLTRRLTEYFQRAGVALDPPETFFLNPGNGTLMVRATAPDLEVLQQAIEVLNAPPPQVTIEARFAEVTDDDLKALGLNQVFRDSGAPLKTNQPAISTTNDVRIQLQGILTEPQYQVVFKVLAQRRGVDVVSAPRLTTLSGRPAQITSLDLKTVVIGVDNIKSSDGSVTNSVRTSSLPFGPTVDVIPFVRPDGFTIEMTLMASMSEFLGYDRPNPELRTSRPGVPLAAELPLPRFRLRQVTTTANVWDGQTLVLGGMVSPKDPKNKKSTPGKNLLIFITPTLIDAAGNRMHRPEEVPNGVPNQRP